MPDSTQWEWSRPVPEVTAGWKVKGTETCGHTVMELGASLMTGSKNNLKLPSACGLHVGQAGVWLLLDL